jgi:hypothetical protein
MLNCRRSRDEILHAFLHGWHMRRGVVYPLRSRDSGDLGFEVEFNVLFNTRCLNSTVTIPPPRKVNVMKKISSPHQPASTNPMLFTLALATAIAVSGCASISASERSTTLAKFEQLSVQPDGTRTWRSTTAAKVGIVSIDPKAITFAPDLRLTEEQQQELRAALSEALARQFAEAGIRIATPQDASQLRCAPTLPLLSSPIPPLMWQVRCFC